MENLGRYGTDLKAMTFEQKRDFLRKERQAIIVLNSWKQEATVFERAAIIYVQEEYWNKNPERCQERRQHFKQATKEYESRL